MFARRRFLESAFAICVIMRLFAGPIILTRSRLESTLIFSPVSVEQIPKQNAPAAGLVRLAPLGDDGAQLDDLSDTENVWSSTQTLSS